MGSISEIEDNTVAKKKPQKDDASLAPVWQELKPGVRVAFRSTESIPVVPESWTEREEQDKKIEEKFQRSLKNFKASFKPK